MSVIRAVRVPMVVAAVLAALGLGGLMVARPSSTPQPKLAGTVIPHRIAPKFALRDQFGHRIALRQFRGHPVVVTFLAANCTQLCPVVAETIRRTLEDLGPAARRVGVLAVTTDPEADAPSLVTHFSKEHGLLHRWHYLTGPRSAVSRVWRAYYVYAPPAGATQAAVNGHTAATYLIDGQGNERVLMTSDPGTALLRDLRILLGIPVTTGMISSVPAPQVGHPAPSFALRSLRGQTVSLARERGHSVILNFWATWCTACRSEMPHLVRWARRVQKDGVVVLGIDQGEPASSVRAFVRKYHISYPILLDSDGTVSGKYEVIGLPTSLLVDPSGNVQVVKAGILEETDFTTLQAAVQEK